MKKSIEQGRGPQTAALLYILFNILLQRLPHCHPVDKSQTRLFGQNPRNRFGQRIFRRFDKSIASIKWRIPFDVPKRRQIHCLVSFRSRLIDGFSHQFPPQAFTAVFRQNIHFRQKGDADACFQKGKANRPPGFVRRHPKPPGQGSFTQIRF